MKKTLLAFVAMLITSSLGFAGQSEQSPQEWLVRYHFNKSKMLKSVENELKSQIKGKYCTYDVLKAEGSLKEGLSYYIQVRCGKDAKSDLAGMKIATITGTLSETDGFANPGTVISFDGYLD